MASALLGNGFDCHHTC